MAELNRDALLEKYSRNVDSALSTLDEEVIFVFHYVDSEFYSKATFSNLKFSLRVYTAGGTKAAVRPSTLFTVTPPSEDHFEALKFLNSCRSRPWPPYPRPSKPSEKDVLVELACQIFLPLGREVVLEKRYYGLLRDKPIPGVSAADLGMGSLETWHGTPDARVRGAHVVFREGTDEYSEARECPSENESDGGTTTVETKLMSKDANLHQAIGTCVVSSFTEKALHSNIKALVPTLLIDQCQYRVCLFDSSTDILLISNPKSLTTKGGLSRSGMTLLWMSLNHR